MFPFGEQRKILPRVRLIANLSPDLIVSSVSEVRKASIYIFLLRLRRMWRRSDPRAQKGLLARDNESQPLADEIVLLLKSHALPELKADWDSRSKNNGF